MSSEPESDLELEIAHVLLIDVVGYSKLLVNAQIELLEELNRIVRSTAHFRAAEAKGKLIRLPTGDGMALLFFDSAEAPVLCALEISQAAKGHPEIQLRMGAHSGPIKEVKDVNDRSNFAGAGINIAQRVLDCGDAGHILISKRLAEDLSSYRHWYPHLCDLGVCEVKHGVRLHVFNLCKAGLGNAALPEKMRQQRGLVRKWRRSTAHWIAGSPLRKALLLAGYAMAAVGITAVCWFSFLRGSLPEKSIAVLPFEILGEEKGNVDFTRGVQDEILTDLSRVAGLKVISSTSVTSYKAEVPRNIREIGNALGVAHVLEGSVRRIDNRVRVYAQLIDARTDAHLWANRYDREIADVFAIQSEIAQEIVAQLQLSLSPQQKAAIQDRPTNDLAAYNLYVRAKGLIATGATSARGNEDFNEAARLLTEAVTRDPAFFLAHYQLANVYDELSLRAEHNPGLLESANAAIQTLFRLRPEAGETHLALAKHLYWGYRDYARARQELSIAQRALPNDPEPPLLTGYIDRRQSQWGSALANLHRALELDPRNSIILQQTALCYWALHRFPEMAAILDRAVSLDPKDIAVRWMRAGVEQAWHADTKPLHSLAETALTADPAVAVIIADRWLDLTIYERDAAGAARALGFLGMNGCRSDGLPFPRSWCEGKVLRLQGDEEKAREAFLKARAEAVQLLDEQPQNGAVVCVLAMADAALGRKEEAIRGGRRATELLPLAHDAINGAQILESLAAIYAWTGEKDLALEQLALALKTPTVLSYGDLRLDPSWDPLRGDPRFEQIVESMAPK